MKFLYQIIDLPKNAYHIIESPSAAERIVRLLIWGLINLIAAWLVIGKTLTSQIANCQLPINHCQLPIAYA